MSKSINKSDKGNRNITDFFARRPSSSEISSQPPSSQPSSSQPTQPQKAGLKPGNKKPNVVNENQVILVSSDSDPVYVKTGRSHISVSSGADGLDVVLADSSVPLKSKKIAVKNTNPKKAMAPPQTQSSAKTTVKRRAHPATTVATVIAGGTATRLAVRRKRKLDWDDSSDDEIFKPDPETMKAELSRAPVLRVPTSPSKVQADPPSVGPPSSPLSLASSSKRRRITPRDVSRIVDHTSGEEADIEEVPSSISDEHELILPTFQKKDPKQIRKNVDKWRRESSATTASFEHSPPQSDYPSTSPTPDPALTASGPVVEEDRSMDVDMTDAANLLQNTGSQFYGESEFEVSQMLNTHDQQPAITEPPASQTPPPGLVLRSLTPPPPPSLPPLPPTPVALDIETKTAQAIARIKAAAEAAAREQLNSSQKEMELGELSDDSDPEFLEFVFKPPRYAHILQHFCFFPLRFYVTVNLLLLECHRSLRRLRHSLQ